MRITLSGVALAYGPRTLFRGLDAHIADGLVTAIVGPSGSGKSTLLAALAGYRRPSAGEIVFHSESGAALPPDPAFITWVPQGSNALPARTALDNVLIGPLARGLSMPEARQRATAALAEVGLGALGASRARELSGGELQRLGFARARAAGRPFIFADEPTSSLDAANVDRIAQLLRLLSADTTIVVATHDPLLVAAADAVIDLRSVA